MGKRGPPRTPLPVLRARGSTLVHGREVEGSIDVEPDRLEAARGDLVEPEWLSGDARALWRSLVPVLEEMGILTRLDAQAVERYCRLYGRWRELERVLDEKGHTFEVYEGSGEKRCLKSVRARPEARLAAEISTHLTRIERELGLSPAARASILADALGGGVGKRESRPAKPGKEGSVIGNDEVRKKEDLLA